MTSCPAFVVPPSAPASPPAPISLPAADDWASSLQVGDVVAFAFPVAEGDAADGARPKTRPCLVLDVEAHAGGRLALLAYGTGAETAANRGLEVHVDPAVVGPAPGVRRPTRFVCARRLLVSLGHSGFDRHPATGSPVLGRLTGSPLARLHAVRARLHAERDIAAERRRERRETRRLSVRGPKLRGIDFTVETRRPPRRALRRPAPPSHAQRPGAA